MSVLFEGFSLNVTSQIQETLCCSICSRVLQNPQQAPCGCRFCYNCIKDFLNNKEKFCLGQTEDCLEIKLNLERDLRQDVIANREVSKLIVKCPFYLCGEECELRKMKNHLELCASSKVLCNNCNEKITRSDQRSHEVNECKEGTVLCEFCSKRMKRRELREEHQNYEHDLLCTQYTDYCPNECEEDKKVVWVKHRSKCKMKYLECPYKTIGCTSNSLILKDMELHLANKRFHHADVLLKHMKNLSNDNSQLNHSLGKVSNEMLNIKKKYEQQKNEMELQEKEIELLKASIEELKIDNINLKKVITVNQGNEKMVNLKEDEKSKKKELEVMFKEKEEYPNKKFNFEEMNTEYVAPEMHIKSDKVRSVWMIKRFSKVNFETSSYFYTHHKGYKMSLRLEKITRGYVTIYAQLHPGENDDELCWPLRKQITVKVMDQECQDRHFEKIILFDKHAGRVCDRKYLSNSGNYGFSKFIAYKELREKPYLLKKNCLLIHCFVDNLNSE